MHLRLPNSRAPHPIARLFVFTAALFVAGIASAACGGSPGASVANLSSSTTTTTTSGTGGASQNASAGNSGSPQGANQQSSFGMGGISVQFAQCMRSHGIPNFPDPNGQGQVQMSGVDPQSSSFEAAQRACAKYSPGGGKPPSVAQQQKTVAQALKFSECMRSHGITDFPDPQVSSSGGGSRISISIKAGGGSDLNPNSPQFQAAQKACQSLMPGPKVKSSASSAG